MMQEMLMKLGVPTYTDTYYTKLDGTPGQVKIGQDMPKPIGWIYGISINCHGTNPENVSFVNIPAIDLSKLYLTFKIGTDLFFNNIRLDTLCFVELPATNKAVYTNPQRYFPCAIPNVTDLKQSYYMNPESIGSTEVPLFIPLTLYYIDKESYDILVQKGYLYRDIKALPPARQ